jgi:hypothetical protein
MILMMALHVALATPVPSESGSMILLEDLRYIACLGKGEGEVVGCKATCAGASELPTRAWSDVRGWSKQPFPISLG